MITLIVGTPDSGKSMLAERIVTDCAQSRKLYYIATMIPFGEEGQRRVEKHRAMRAGKGFITLEWPDNLEKRCLSITDWDSSVVLLECMSNYVGNEMHSKENAGMSGGAVVDKIINGVMAIAKQTSDIVVVTNEFLPDDDGYDEETREYISLVTAVNERLMKPADTVYRFRGGEWIRYENC